MTPRFNQPHDSESVANVINALRRAGWSIGHTAFAGPNGLVWVVSGINGENGIVAEGATELEARRAACEQARGCGMLGRPVVDRAL